MFGIRAKLNLAIGGLFGLLVAVSLYATSVFNSYSDVVKRMAVDDLDSVIAAREMHDAVNEVSDAAQDSLRTGSELDAARIDSAAATFDRALSLQLSRMTLPGEPQLTEDIQAKWFEILAATTLVKDAAAAERTPAIQDHLVPTIRGLRPLLTKLSQWNTQSMKTRHDEAGAKAAWARWQLRVTMLVGLIAAAGFATAMGRRITSSLRALTAAARAVGSGDLEQHLAASGKDEFGQFIEAFNRMSTELRRFRALDAEKLQRSYQTTQTAIDSLPDGVIMLNAQGKVELANQTATRLLGIAAGQERPEERAPWLREAIERPSPTLESYRTSVAIDDGGKQRYFLPQSVWLRNGGGRTIGTIVILTDVTDFRRLDELKDSLLSMASHELKTPLTSMRIILPLLLEQSLGSLNAKQVELLQVVRDATERMRGIVERILDIGRLASGKMPMDTKAVKPADLIGRAVAGQEAAYAQKRVALRTELAEGLPAVRCDPVQIDHVLDNLLKNALQYSTSARSVTVSAAAGDDTVTFSIRDMGCGIEAVYLPRVFETFFRVPGQRSDTGTGLGLALVKQIVEYHGGRVCVESIVGQGSTFSFTLPIAASPASGSGPAQTNGAPVPAEIDMPILQEVRNDEHAIAHSRS